jgi:pyruvate/2-oxoglutarate dehydrogenase complex dihydrolipoamide acyltransferase (E2) component
MARRHGVTLIVTLLHCPALTEINAGKSLLNWGFAVDGKVRPVGALAAARQPPAPSPSPSAGKRQPSAGQPTAAQPSPAQQGTARPEARAQSVTASPSVRVAAAFSCVALLIAGIGLAYSRRRRPRA